MNNKIKVLHIHTLPVISGSGINTFLSMKYLNKSKYETALACAAGGKLETLIKENDFEFIPVKNLVNPINIIKDIKALIEIIKIIKTNNYDIIHTHNSKAGFIGRLAAKIAGTKKIVHTVHGFSFHNKEGFIRRNLFLILEKIAVYFCTDMIFISQPLIDWGKQYNIYKKNRTTKIYSGIEIDRFDFNIINSKLRKEIGVSEKDFVIGEVAKLWEGKGHFTILKAAKILKKTIPNLKIVFIGEGYLENKLKNYVESNNMKDYVVFTGFRNDIEKIYKILDIALLISDFEGMGRVILEAYALKIPVIATNVGGIVELVKDNDCGFLIEPENYNYLVEKILKLYYSKELRMKFTENAYKLINEEFSAIKMAKDIEEVYEKEL